MANVARLDINPMSPGQPTSGNSSGGGKRSKSGEFAAVSEASAGPKASKPASIRPNAPDIDSGWEESVKPNHSSAAASAQALSPKRVISIGPPATEPFTNELARAESPKANGEPSHNVLPKERIEPERSGLPKEKRRQIEPLAGNASRKVSAVPAEAKSDIALLNRRSRTDSKSKGQTQSTTKPGSLAAGVDASTLKKLLTEGPESDFDPSDIARLVTHVMGSQPPPAIPELTKKPAFPTVSAAPGVSTEPIVSSVITVSSAPPSPTVATEPTASSVPIVSTSQTAPPPSSATASETTGSATPLQSENISENIMEPDGWDVPDEVPAVEKQVTAPAAKPEQRPVPTAKPEQSPVPTGNTEQVTAPTAKSEQVTVKSEAKSSDKPPQSGPASEKPHSKADKKKAVTSAKSKPQGGTEGPESELSGEFFSIGAPVSARVEDFHEHDEFVDPMHMLSISPEVRARRAKYRIIVLALVVGMTLLLVAAIALKMLHKH